MRMKNKRNNRRDRSRRDPVPPSRPGPPPNRTGSGRDGRAASSTSAAHRVPPALPDLQPISAPQSFLTSAAGLNIEFDTGDLDKIGLHLAMLLAANETTNLTAITDPTEAWSRHVLDSLTLLPFLADLPDDSRVIDVGSGGGFPGMPLAICLPRIRFTLLEATGKKAVFLRTVAEHLGLSNVTVHSDRAERAAQDRGEKTANGRTGGHRERYDAVMARAVGRLVVLAELTVPFAKVGGRVLLIKGQKATEELEEATAALHLLKAVHVITQPTPTGQIVVLEKSSATPRDYPRADGEPSRVPLGCKR